LYTVSDDNILSYIGVYWRVLAYIAILEIKILQVLHTSDDQTTGMV